MKSHLRRFAMAYFVGALFVLWQFTIAFKAQAVTLTPSIRAGMGWFDWLVFQANVLLMCLPTVIAFLNQSISKSPAAEPVKTDDALAKIEAEIQVERKIDSARTVTGLMPVIGQPAAHPDESGGAG